MNSHLDPETIKIPAYLRKKAIVSQARQKLILTALDRKEAGLSPKSKKALAPIVSKTRKFSPTPRHLNERQPVINHDYIPPVTPVLQHIFSKKIPPAGIVTNYLDHIQVAIIKLTAMLKSGDIIIIAGEDYIFIQTVEEMQLDRKPLQKAKKGSHIGLKVNHPASIKSNIYKITPHQT